MWDNTQDLQPIVHFLCHLDEVRSNHTQPLPKRTQGKHRKINSKKYNIRTKIEPNHQNTLWKPGPILKTVPYKKSFRIIDDNSSATTNKAEVESSYEPAVLVPCANGHTIQHTHWCHAVESPVTNSFSITDIMLRQIKGVFRAYRRKINNLQVPR